MNKIAPLFNRLHLKLYFKISTEKAGKFCLKIKILKSRKKWNPGYFFNSLTCILIWFIYHLILAYYQLKMCHLMGIMRMMGILCLTEIYNEYLQTSMLIKTSFYRKQTILRKDWICFTLKLIPFKIVRKYWYKEKNFAKLYEILEKYQCRTCITTCSFGRQFEIMLVE